RTYFAITHKRDLDSVAPVPPILAHRGWSALAGDVRFAMRADSMEPGFLARMVLRPRWFSRLLRPIGVGPILRGVGIYPIYSLRIRPAEEWLREALWADGGGTVGEWLAPAFVAHLAAAVGDDPARLAELPVARLLAWRYHLPLQEYTGQEIFAGQARRRAERRAVEAVKRTLAEQAEWLWQGGSIYSAPEGKFSPDGHFSPITGGFHRVLRAAPAETRVVPVAITYDYMTSGRMRMFVDLAPPIERAPSLAPRAFDAALRDAWRGAVRFHCTLLGAEFLADNAGATFTTDDLVRHVQRRAQGLAAAGRHVDERLLSARGARSRGRSLLVYARRHELVRPTRDHGGHWEALPPRPMPAVPLGGVGYGVAPLAYARNELEEVLAQG
ncbi:MAG TPA: hypothetical protein VJQ45_13360, partial [Ktedonobacterales bacterium]|nr:hypothetical protein [Ktedonobacterales bacterium]